MMKIILLSMLISAIAATAYWARLADRTPADRSGSRGG